MVFLKALLELILLGILGGGVYLGIKKGFISIMAKPVKVFASFMLAVAICGGFARLVIAPIIEAPITNYISSFLYENCEYITPDTAADELPTLLKISAAAFNIDVYAIASNAEGDIISTIVSELASPAIYVIAVVISFFAVYFIGRLLFSLAMYIVDVLLKGGIIGKINKTLGIVFGVCIAFIGAWAFAGFVKFILNTPILASSNSVAAFRGGLLYRFFNSFSPIELLLSF